MTGGLLSPQVTHRAQGVKDHLSSWPHQVGSYLTVCTCGREPSWESRYIRMDGYGAIPYYC